MPWTRIGGERRLGAVHKVGVAVNCRVLIINTATMRRRLMEHQVSTRVVLTVTGGSVRKLLEDAAGGPGAMYPCSSIPAKRSTVYIS